MSFNNESGTYDPSQRRPSSSADSGYFGDSFTSDCTTNSLNDDKVDMVVDLTDSNLEDDELVLKPDGLLNWWDKITEKAMPFWEASEVAEPEQDASKKEKISYIFSALESGIQGFSQFTRALCSEIETRDQSINELELENQTLAMRNFALANERDVVTKERDDLELECQTLAMRTSSLTYERDTITKERDAIVKEREALKEENGTLTKDKGTEAFERACAEKERDGLMEQVKMLKKDVKTDVEELKSELKQLKEKNKALILQNFAMKKEAEEVRAEKKKLDVSFGIISRERDSLRTAIDNMRGEAPYHVLARWMENPGYGFGF
ncbi:hypothetical protein HYALB_00001179 [Hymenoscyphus albidus]|uniref:Uncharacterized protein n=1 Tax=Hymenoscyphus albidus TaxID=595503 RepID=A0A9N9LE91_9HELO|nr:hypothetical protein HYALB_00001179 [Hymenoscyphus albidus]